MKLRRLFLFTAITLMLILGAFVLFHNVKGKETFNYEKPVAEKITLGSFSNLYKISDSVYRSEQPGKEEMVILEKFGIRTILNLRNYHTDDNEAEGTHLILEKISMNASEINEENIMKAMLIIKDSEKPVLIHCLHGSDRTGCMIAAYRIIFQNWTKEAAIAELRNPVFGYHASWFPNIVETLNKMDVEKFRKKLGVRT